ncbi:membrane protein, partial [Lacticaseibacillus rhamnosus]
MNSLFGYDPQDTWLHRLTGATKMLAFLGISVIVMASYDTRFVCAVMLASIILFLQAKIHWHQISLVIKIITIFAVVNLLLVYVFSPQYGVGLYGSKHVLIHAGYLTLTQEQLFY